MSRKALAAGSSAWDLPLARSAYFFNRTTERIPAKERVSNEDRRCCRASAENKDWKSKTRYPGQALRRFMLFNGLLS